MTHSQLAVYTLVHAHSLSKQPSRKAVVMYAAGAGLAIADTCRRPCGSTPLAPVPQCLLLLAAMQLPFEPASHDARHGCCDQQPAAECWLLQHAVLAAAALLLLAATCCCCLLPFLHSCCLLLPTCTLT